MRLVVCSEPELRERPSRGVSEGTHLMLDIFDLLQQTHLGEWRKEGAAKLPQQQRQKSGARKAPDCAVVKVAGRKRDCR